MRSHGGNLENDGRGDNARQVRWYAVYTRPRHEKKVAETLSQKGVEHFLPLWRVRRRWSDRYKTVEFPLFPNYLFVRFDLQDRDAYFSILQTRGIVCLVRFNGCIEPVPDEEVEGVRRVVTSDLPYDPYSYLQEGRWVEVKRGPLKGLRGYVVRREEDCRLVISVHLLGRSVAVQVSPWDVEALV